MKNLYNKQSLLLIGAILVPFFIITAYIGKYAVNVPVTDQYALVPLFQKIDDGTLSFSDIWQQHNEHRIVFPKIILLTLATLTDWSIKAEIIVSLLLSLASFIAIVLMIRRAVEAGAVQVFLTFITGLWFFSPVQWQNWLWGWQLEWFLCICVSLYAFYFLSRIGTSKGFVPSIGIAMIFAFIATFSLGSGMFIWAAGLLLLWLQKASIKNISVWIAAALFSTGLYFIGYKNPSDDSVVSSVLEHPIEFIRHFFAYLGRPVSSEPYAAILAGLTLFVVLCVTVFFLYKKNLLSKYTVWLAIITYALMAGAASSASRIDLGIINALSSRYTAFSLLFIIALIVILVGLITKPGLVLVKNYHIKPILIVVSLLLAPFIASTYYNGTLGMRKQSSLFHYIKSCSSVDNPTKECLYEVYFPSLEDAKTRLDYLKEKGYGGY